MAEINPHHPMTKAMREQWQKLCAITVQELPDGIHLRLVTMEEAKALARKHGGLPQ